MTTYSEVTVANFNDNPPADDGSTVDANKFKWQTHIDEIGQPLKTAIEQTQTNLTAAFNSLNGALYGLKQGCNLANNASDPTNDIDFKSGVVRSSSNEDTMIMPSTLTKRLDANWQEGDVQGGLDTGSVADGWYHCFIIKRADSGWVDALFSTSLTPTLPASYDYYRRVGSILRASSAIVAFWNDGDLWLWQNDRFITDEGQITPTQLWAIDIPPDVMVQPIIFHHWWATSSFTTLHWVVVATDARSIGSSKGEQYMDRGYGWNDASGNGQAGPGFWSNTSRQVGLHHAWIGPGNNHDLVVRGWIDDCGRTFRQ